MDIMKKYMHNCNKIAEVPPTTIKNVPYLSIALLSGFILSQKSPPSAKHWPSNGRSPPERGWLGLHFHLFFTNRNISMRAVIECVTMGIIYFTYV